MERNEYAIDFEKKLVAEWVKEGESPEYIREILEEVPTVHKSFHIYIKSEDTSDISKEFESYKKPADAVDR